MRSAYAVSKRDQQAGEASGTFSLRVVPRSRRATSRSAARSALSIVIVRPASCAAKPGCTVRQVPLRSQDAPFPKFFGGPVGEPSASHDQIPHRSLGMRPRLRGPNCGILVCGAGFHQSTTRNDRRTSSLFRSVKTTTTLRGKSTGAVLDPSGGPSAPGRRFNGERGAPLRYAPTPHSPQGRLSPRDCTGLLRKKDA